MLVLKCSKRLTSYWVPRLHDEQEVVDGGTWIGRNVYLSGDTFWCSRNGSKWPQDLGAVCKFCHAWHGEGWKESRSERGERHAHVWCVQTHTHIHTHLHLGTCAGWCPWTQAPRVRGGWRHARPCRLVSLFWSNTKCANDRDVFGALYFKIYGLSENRFVQIILGPVSSLRIQTWAKPCL